MVVTALGAVAVWGLQRAENQKLLEPDFRQGVRFHFVDAPSWLEPTLSLEVADLTRRAWIDEQLPSQVE